MSLVLTESFRALSDSTRLRALLLLRREPLNVGELTGVLGLAQSSVSSLLKQLGEAGLVASARAGRHTVYRAAPAPSWLESALAQERLSAADLALLQDIRAARLRDQHGGTYEGRHAPGRSWETLARSLVRLGALGEIADFGVGTGDLTLLLARAAERVVAVDRSAQALASLWHRAEVEGYAGLETCEADFEGVAIDPPVDLVVLSLALCWAREPAAALSSAYASLRAGGRVWLTTLQAHEHAEVRERFGHRWLGFERDTLAALLGEAGFVDIHIEPGGRDRRPPRLRTWIAIGRRSP